MTCNVLCNFKTTPYFFLAWSVTLVSFKVESPSNYIFAYEPRRPLDLVHFQEFSNNWNNLVDVGSNMRLGKKTSAVVQTYSEDRLMSYLTVVLVRGLVRDFYAGALRTYKKRDCG